MESLTSRAAEGCQAYIKPGVNWEELDEELDSSCGCNPGPPVKCTGLEFYGFDFGLDGMGLSLGWLEWDNARYLRIAKKSFKGLMIFGLKNPQQPT